MKLILVSVFIMNILSGKNIASAQNLVPNGSFEEYDNCPKDCSCPDDQVLHAIGWSSFSPTPDYFNSCGPVGKSGVPANYDGYQLAASGNAYCGLYTSLLTNNLREVIGRELSAPLVIGNKYYASIKVCLADSHSIASNKLGIAFTNMRYNNTVNAPIKNQAKIYASSIITDDTHWNIISGSFIADSAYGYIMIGNFFTDNMTEILNLTYPYSKFFGAYYYVDDVCLSEDSLGCELNTSFNNYSLKDNFRIFPNPANKHIYLNINDEFDCSLNNVLGQKLSSFRFNGQSNIDVSQIPSGVYFLEIKSRNKTSIRKQLIIH